MAKAYPQESQRMGRHKKKTHPIKKLKSVEIDSRDLPELTGEHWICILINSAYYLLEIVFIHKEEKGHRLVVIKKTIKKDGHRKLWVSKNKTYATLATAQSMFSYMFGKYRLNKEMKMEWSIEYVVDNNWLQPRLPGLQVTVN